MKEAKEQAKKETNGDGADALALNRIEDEGGGLASAPEPLKKRGRWRLKKEGEGTGEEEGGAPGQGLACVHISSRLRTRTHRRLSPRSSRRGCSLCVVVGSRFVEPGAAARGRRLCRESSGKSARTRAGEGTSRFCASRGGARPRCTKTSSFEHQEGEV